MAGFRPEHDPALDLPEAVLLLTGAASGSARAVERLGPDGLPAASLYDDLHARLKHACAAGSTIDVGEHARLIAADLQRALANPGWR